MKMERWLPPSAHSTTNMIHSVTFPGPGFTETWEGQVHCFHRDQRSREHILAAQFLADNMQSSVLILSPVWKMYRKARPSRTKSSFPLTRNPPLGLVTSVVPMVMFSLTSCKLGTVVFSKRRKYGRVNRVRQTERAAQAENSCTNSPPVFSHRERAACPLFLTSCYNMKMQQPLTCG